MDRAGVYRRWRTLTYPILFTRTRSLEFACFVLSLDRRLLAIVERLTANSVNT